MNAPSRNDPCPCGSGKKFKKCCMGNAPKAAAPAELLMQAVALHQSGRLNEAEMAYRNLLAREPDNYHAIHYLGLIALQKEHFQDAVNLIEEALKRNRKIPAFHCNLGNAYKGLGRIDSAIAAYSEAVRLEPKFQAVHCNLGNLFLDQGKLDEAVASYQRTLAIQPDFAEALYGLGTALLEKGEVGAAAGYLRRAVALNPAYAEAHINLGRALQKQNELDAAIASYRKAISVKPDIPAAYSNLLVALHYAADYSPQEVFEDHLRFGRQFEAPLKSHWREHSNVRDTNKRLKVGYVSGDYNNHSVAFFIEPVLLNHDRETIETYCYYNHTRHDHVTDRIIAAADHWVACAGLSDDQLAERIRSDGIDILVDLSGHTAHNRLLTFARKPAPVQLTWIGCPYTTGLSAMDYRLTDENLDPTGLTEQFHTETLLRLPSSAIFRPAAESPEVNALPALTSGQFTFACLNNPDKINQQAVHLWARILAALPRARLMLGNATDSQLRQKLAGMFAQEGIPAEQLVLHPRMPLADYLALHHQIDLALDPFPYNGGTTTCHSLWMGVPVITLAGNSTISRSGSAVLSQVGLTEFITASEEAYLECALEFARDLPRLNQVRQTLRERMKSNPGSTPESLTRSLESVYRTIWQKWCDTPEDSALRPAR